MKTFPEIPTDAMFAAFKSVNCTGAPGDERFSFSGDYGNWLACYQAMRAAAPSATAHATLLAWMSELQTHLIEPIAQWERKNGTVAAPVTQSERDELLDILTSAAVYLPFQRIAEDVGACTGSAAGKGVAGATPIADALLSELDAWAKANPHAGAGHIGQRLLDKLREVERELHALRNVRG